MGKSEFYNTPQPEDDKIGELFYEDGAPYRIIDGKKIRQLDPTEENKEVQKAINRYRASGCSSPSEYLKRLYGY